MFFDYTNRNRERIRVHIPRKAYLFAISLIFIVTLLYAAPQVMNASVSHNSPPTADSTHLPYHDVGILAVVAPINAPPEADDDSYTTNEDSLLFVTAPGVLGNDHDVDQDPLLTMLVDAPSHGLLILSSDGSFSYEPESDFFGVDTFTYRANDSISYSNIATVTITVNPVNDAPIASADQFTIDENTVLTILTSDLLSNDYDADGDSLQLFIESYPSFGSLDVLSDQEFIYTPNPDWFGTDSFTYFVSDGTENSMVVQVTITVQEVLDGSTIGCVSGRGWIRDANGNKGYFAFFVHYKPNGDISGVLLYSFTVGKSIYIVKSTEWLELAIDGNYAYFEAKCSITKITMHKFNVLHLDDDYMIGVEILDNRVRCGKDIFQIRIYDSSGQIWYEAGYDPIGYVHGTIAIHIDKHWKLFHCNRGMHINKHMRSSHCHCRRW
jgi:VCBS repeat-containing protein